MTLRAEGTEGSGFQVLPVLQSLAGGLLGLTVAVLLTRVVLWRLHPHPLTALVGIPTVCALLAGWAVGLVAPRWPHVLTVTAWCAFIATWLWRWPLPPSLWLNAPLAVLWFVPADIQLALAASLLFALVGTEAGRRWRTMKGRVVIGSCVLLAGFAATFVVPEVAYVVRADQFMRTRQGELAALVTRNAVRVPANARWSRKLSRQPGSALAVEGSWNATALSGRGVASLRLHLSSDLAGEQLASAVQDLDFEFQPKSPKGVRAGREAQAVAKSLGIRPGDVLLETAQHDWTARWGRQMGNQNFEYTLLISRAGSVHLRGEWQWGGWD